MRAGAHFAGVEAALRRNLDAGQLRLVEVLRDRAAAQSLKEDAYAGSW